MEVPALPGVMFEDIEFISISNERQGESYFRVSLTLRDLKL